MSDKIKDQMSAFLDDELPDDEAELLLRRLGTDAELRRMAARYLLIGQSLRRERVPALDLDRRIARALEDEDAYRASDVEEEGPPRWWRPVAGVAVAATVAVIALMGLRNTGEGTAPEAVTADAGVAVDADPAEFDYVVPADIPAVRPVSAVPARLTNYMISHGERAGTLVRSGMHSRIVTYGSTAGSARSVTVEDAPGGATKNVADEPGR
jgi:hypothetical protein